MRGISVTRNFISSSSNYLVFRKILSSISSKTLFFPTSNPIEIYFELMIAIKTDSLIIKLIVPFYSFFLTINSKLKTISESGRKSKSAYSTLRDSNIDILLSELLLSLILKEQRKKSKETIAKNDL